MDERDRDLMTSAVLARVEPRSRVDPVTVLSVFLVLEVCIPARLIVGPLGAAGTPATLLGICAGIWWASTRLVPHLGGCGGQQPVRIALALFGSALLLGYTSGMLRSLSPVEARAADRLVLGVLGWFGVALLCADGVPDRARLERLLRRLVVLGGLLAVMGIVEFAFPVVVNKLISIPGLVSNTPPGGLDVREGLKRVQGTAIHPIEFGFVLSMVLPLAVRHGLVSVRRRDWLPALFIAAALPLSVSRSALLGGLTAFLVLLAGWQARRRTNVVVAAAGLLVVLGLLLPSLVDALKGLFLHFGNDPSTKTRTNDYHVVEQLFRQRPLFGRGTGTFVPSEYRILDNQYLLTLVESGLLGLLGLLGVFFTAMSCARGARHRSDDESTRELGQALAASVAVGLVGFVSLDAFSFPMATGLLFLLFGCCGALWRLVSGVDSSLR